MEIDSTAANKELFDNDLIEAYYHTKNYEKAIQYADKAIRKDTARGLRILNFIIPNFQYKAKSELAIGDTLSAITTLSSLAKNFNGQSWSQVGLLAKRTNNDSLVETSFENAIEFYQEYLENRPKAWGYQLSLLEMYIIADKRQSAEELHSHLKDLVDEEDYRVLLEYFRIMLAMIYEPSAKINELNQEFQSYLTNKKTRLKKWSFQLILDWNQANNLSLKQKAGIIELTDSIRRTKISD
jgi:tetratricopeptide (TPR) repeat protein